MTNSITRADLAQLQTDLLAQDATAPQAAGDWRVRSSRRARRMRIQIAPHGAVDIVVPHGTRAAVVAAFVAEHRDWIDTQRQRFAAAYTGVDPLPHIIELPAIGQHFAVRYAHGPARVRELSGTLLVSGELDAPRRVQAQLRAWLRQSATGHLRRQAHHLAAETGLQPKALQIRLQRTRWGSCSGSGTISLNAALLLRQPEELRYVLIHELCHLRHLNHSPRFWQLVARFEPNYRMLDAALDAAWTDTPLWLLER